ncbi:vacuolar protein sorting-associated protein 72 homolog [Anabrus simplex]|uniref:vacuolar protein sorting-associated protein 72 homolog n=1 Tax=Anabrus simplex TaxID=316456 RepID=UPI0035A33439
MALAATRDRRSNAGSRMAKLLDEEEEDEFYKTTYGGFSENENDDDYQSEEEGEDEVDSDFSIDENDEVISDQEDEVQKRTKRLVTKAYKEPIPSAQKADKSAESKPKKPRKVKIVVGVDQYERKSIRRSTAAKSAATLQRIKERNEEGRRRKGRRARNQDAWKPTQEELLEEAKITEEENLKSLEKFQKLELEKKKTRTVKKTVQGPMIRYHSMTMPLVEEVKLENESPITVDEEPSTNQEPLPQTVKPAEEEEKLRNVEEGRCSRTFITFTDERSFREVFPEMKPKPPKPHLCPFTRVPARYYDPVTQHPFRMANSFRILREAYYQQLEMYGDKNNPDVARWIEWRRTMREKKSAFLPHVNRSIRLEPEPQPAAS